MKSYRDRYDQISFVADPEGVLIRKFDVKTPLITFAKRTTFVIAPDGKIAHVDAGKHALAADAAVSCALSFK